MLPLPRRGVGKHYGAGLSCPTGTRYTTAMRKTSRIWRIHTLSAGISLPCCLAKERTYLRLRTIDAAGRYPLTSPLIPITESMISFDRNQ